jgi:hypothetical protein
MMNHSALRTGFLSVLILFAFLLFNFSSVNAADGKKWDGKAYPFGLLDPSKPNSESNPFIIDTAGKLAYIGKLAAMPNDLTFPIKGYNYLFKDNFVKLTADVDMNGAMYEFVPIPNCWINFDGGGHVIDNLRISDKKTPLLVILDEEIVEMYLALFQEAESIKNLGIGKGSTITYNRDFYPYKTWNFIVSVRAASIANICQIMDNCFSEATITVKGKGDVAVGGLAGDNRYTITNSYFKGTILVEGDIISMKQHNFHKNDVPGSLCIGGVSAEPGDDYSPTLKHGGIFSCYSAGTITAKVSCGELRIGGVAGYFGFKSECKDLYHTGQINVSAIGDINVACIGGVIATGNTFGPIHWSKPRQYTDPGQIYNTGNINVNLLSGTNICVGGIGGGEIGKVSFNHSSAAILGASGFVNSYNSGSITVSSTGNVESLNVGGIAGYGRMVYNSYNTGSISCETAVGANLYAGGIGGRSVYIQNCYNTGTLSSKGSGTNLVGGILGIDDIFFGEVENKYSAIINGFWLKQPGTSKITNGVGASNATSKSKEPFYGTVCSFESPTSSVMERSDVRTTPKKSYEGTLLKALNELVPERQDRHFRKWKIDSSNGGYPVFE